MNAITLVSPRAWLYPTVFMTGAAIMVIELLGTRIVVPFYGNSLYVWSSLISVTMIALAIGYWVGGRWADATKKTGVAVIVALASLFTLLIPVVAKWVLLATDQFGLRLGVFLSALLLFLPALTLLGMVGPFAIKLATRQLDSLGNTAGSIYAVSTLGSVISTLALGFFLLPILGTREIFIITGLLLSVLAIVIGVIEKKYSLLQLAMTPCLLVVALNVLLAPKLVNAAQSEIVSTEFKVVSEQESLYGWVRVIDQPRKNLRILSSDASAIGASNINDGVSRLIYQDIVALLPKWHGNMKRVLIVGLGAGHMAGVLKKQYGLEVDTLEIDPAVQDAAVKYFGFQANGASIVGDARYEIRHLQGPYDLIIHDCFTGGSEPAHLLTTETLTQLNSLLAQQGLLALNFVGFRSAEHNQALSSVAKTLKQVFNNTETYLSETGKDFNDFIFLASHQPLDMDASGLGLNQKNWLNERKITISTDNGSVLTDNFNPLEHQQLEKSEYYRRFIVEWLGANVLLR